MQFRPDANELLADIASLLEDKVIDAVTGPLQHQVRVAANLARIVEREVRLGDAAAAAEQARLVPFVGGDGDLAAMRSRLCERLLSDAPIDDGELASIYDALQATLRDDLAISKPGYDAWTGA
jgi:Domain of unknown function (DUF6285)